MGACALFTCPRRGQIRGSCGRQRTTTTGNSYTVTNLAFAIWSEGQWGSADSKNIGVVVVQNDAIVAASTGTATQFGGNGGDENHAYPNTS